MSQIAIPEKIPFLPKFSLPMISLQHCWVPSVTVRATSTIPSVSSASPRKAMLSVIFSRA